MLTNYTSQKYSLSIHTGRVPHVCKGTGGQECYRYVPTNDTWVVSEMLQHKHIRPGYTYHNEFGLVISGHSSGNRTSVEHLFDNQTIQVPACIETIVDYDRKMVITSTNLILSYLWYNLLSTLHMGSSLFDRTPLQIFLEVLMLTAW